MTQCEWSAKAAAPAPTLTQPPFSPFSSLGLGRRPVLLAPLAGVSDHPFRRVCAAEGAALTYVEMLSATALIYESRRTYEMMKRHESEAILGVQLTGRNADDVAKAVGILDRYNFDTIDLNMGCPVTKVVRSGSGSAILKEPERVYQTVKMAREATDKPLSVKIRLGWDKQTISAQEVVDAAERAGAVWITVHGRLRNDDYATPVDLPRMAALKQQVRIPVIGNGNIFSRADAERMYRATGVDAVMVSRGALGNPWVFREINGDIRPVGIDDWTSTVMNHLRWQGEEYGDSGAGAVCMRKHLLWYVKGWPGARRIREQVVQAHEIDRAKAIVLEFANELARQGIKERAPVHLDEAAGRFVWDPKFDMDRGLDRGVGDDCIVDSSSAQAMA